VRMREAEKEKGLKKKKEKVCYVCVLKNVCRDVTLRVVGM